MVVPTRGPYSAKARELRVLLELEPGDGPSDRDLMKLIRHVGGDVDLAATALLMDPRPAWLPGIVGDG